jgi:hypothetical protein
MQAQPLVRWVRLRRPPWPQQGCCVGNEAPHAVIDRFGAGRQALAHDNCAAKAALSEYDACRQAALQEISDAPGDELH